MVANSRGRELRKLVQQSLINEGAENLELSYTGTSHQRIDFTVKGVKSHFVFASTPSGGREFQNTTANARRKARRLKSL